MAEISHCFECGATGGYMDQYGRCAECRAADAREELELQKTCRHTSGTFHTKEHGDICKDCGLTIIENIEF